MTPTVSKYEPLEDYLGQRGESEVPMTFGEIEEVIGAELPPSAFDHRAWWSNNPSNSVITYAWLGAGYKSAEVDMAGRKLVFRKSAEAGPPPGTDDAEPGPDDPGLGGDSSGAAVAPSGGFFSRVFGALKGTVTIKPGTDLTEPVGEDWDAAR